MNLPALISLMVIATAAVHTFGWLNGMAIVCAVYLLAPGDPRPQ